ncbi:SusC/RagA family TonB-linked outer membrane protein [Winogradskyella bathintestinalis]|uniref:TonB-dependent receptor n=1 Tax=Winogradskyella bathintestinalis TaxID=3035208 RepID=A0ABT7ZX32_9FLAO|nr:TonB-dependent receptor [Winogradskyella bathintestinalis]MDN3493537.1 TonB-dependent receptor [Winogradskyella bathintestinalis]
MKLKIISLSIILTLLGNALMFAQIEIKGTVKSKVDGQPLSGSNILIKNKKSGTIADFDGNYVLTVNSTEDVLVYSYQGFKSKEVLVGNQTIINVELEEDITSLNEIVVIGYGSSSKKDLSGAVSSIKAKDLEASKVTTPDEFVQGRVSGLLLTQTSGQPGAATSVRIRGSSSINAGSEPLYVIDGFPVDSNSDNVGGSVTEGPNLNALSTISPSDIESIDVLKDASATAIYGSRGANGVIIITTKRGINGKAQINYDTYLSVSQVGKELDVLNAGEFAFYINEARYNNGDPRFYTNPFSFGEGTDWQGEIFGVAFTNNHDLSIKGGNEKIKYALSASYMNQEGIIIETDFTRYNFRANLDFKASDKLKIENSFSVSRSDYNSARTDTDGGLGVSSAVTGAYLFNPMLPVFDSEGNYVKGNFEVQDDGTFMNSINGSPEMIQDFASPVAYQNLLSSKGKTTRVLDNLAINWELLNNLTLKVSGGVDMVLHEEYLFRVAELDFGNSASAYGAKSKRLSTNLLAETTLTYENTFNNKHRLNAFIGASIQEFTIDEIGISAQDFSTENFGFDNLSQFSSIPGISDVLVKSKLLSYFGRLNYILSDKYIFTVTGRVDGSSKFGDGNKYGFFPSGAFAWNVSDEDFMKNSNMYLKLRLGYGVIGNESILPYSSLASFGTNYQPFNNIFVSGIYPTSPGNPELKWERTEQYNVGLDLRFFNDRVGITVDTYIKNTKDLLLNLEIPTQTGASQLIVNAGEVRNSGVEFSLNTTNIESDDFTWDTNITAAYNKNEITNLAGLDNIPTGNSILGLTGWQRLVEGGEIGAFYGYVSDGIMQLDDTPANTPLFATDNGTITPGERKYMDLNGDGMVDADNDRTFLGNPVPEYTFGITNTFRYKGLDLNIFFQGVAGNEIANFNRLTLEDLNGRNNVLKEAFANRWTPQNPSNEYTRAYAGVRTNRFSDVYIEDGSYLRLKSITLGYSISSKFLSKMAINRLRVYVSGKNLYTFTKYSGVDPEVSWGGQNNALSAGADFGGYPISKTYLMGININF